MKRQTFTALLIVAFALHMTTGTIVSSESQRMEVGDKRKDIPPNQIQVKEDANGCTISFYFKFANNGENPTTADLLLDIAPQEQSIARKVSVKEVTALDSYLDREVKMVRAPIFTRVSPSKCNNYCDGNVRLGVLDLATNLDYKVSIRFEGGAPHQTEIFLWARFLHNVNRSNATIREIASVNTSELSRVSE